MFADAPADAAVRVGLTGAGVEVPAPPFAPEPPLKTLPASTTMAASVDPDFGSEEVLGETDDEVSPEATAVEGTKVAAAPAEVEDPPDPAAVPVVPDPVVDVAAAAEVDPEPEAEVVEAEVVEPDAVEPDAVEPDAVEPEPVVAAEPVSDAHDAAAVTLPVAEDAAAAAHWDDTGELAPPDAVAPSVASLAPVEPSVGAWATVLASVSTVVAALVAHAATPAGTVAAEEHVGVVGDAGALSARAPGDTDQSTKLAATNANHHAACLQRRIDVPAKAPLRRLMSMSPSDANVKKKQLAISRSALARAPANHYLAAVLPLLPNCSARSPFCIKTRV